MLEVCAIFIAGVWAGGINVVVGSGTLVTFPTLLLFGYSPLVANVSNNIGMVAGGISGTYGYRRELEGNKPILKRLSPASICGSLTGALLLLVLPEEAFKSIVPVLIAIGVLMVIIGPAIQRRGARRNAELGGDHTQTTRSRVLLTAGIFVLGIYGGYFGAAQGVLLVGLMSMMLTEGIQRITAIKNVLSTVVNAVAALTFVAVAWDLIDWKVVALIGSGAFVGGYLGAHVGRRLPASVLRAMIVVIGLLAIIKIVFFD
ncbi:MAG: sulfite exporter TauE/SafE family protein [Actinomycetota bacterium]|nr:sulfite exporter TauE/SafE family protein [Actinomycetota bacterium]